MNARVLPTPGFDAALVLRIVQDFREVLGAEFEVQVVRAAAIAPDTSGNYRFIMSHALAAS